MIKKIYILSPHELKVQIRFAEKKINSQGSTFNMVNSIRFRIQSMVIIDIKVPYC
jgi:hypothetical protein